MLVIVASALLVLAAWPAFIHARSGAAIAADPIMRLSPQPVQADYLRRDAGIAFLESRYKRDSADMITPARLSGQYMQRYRERGDIGDVLRAEAAAKTSLVALPGNPGGELAVASADVALHRFYDAKAHLRTAYHADTSNPNVGMLIASVDLELGDYDEAQRLIDAHTRRSDIAATVITSRWYEISGRLDEATRILDRAMHYADSIFEAPAERRAWYHFRLGELRYLAGDNAGAIAAERDAIGMFPDDVYAWQALARISEADRRFDDAEAAAKKAVELVPSPEVLGILADEQDRHGEAAAAQASRAQIDAVERLGNAQHVNDRLVAMYEADHDIRTHDAYAIAKREIRVRDDIYAEDTLAWCAAKAGRWSEAEAAARKALRFDTQDARIQYHAGVIFQHAGNAPEAAKRLERALALNPRFSATQADDARSRLASLTH